MAKTIVQSTRFRASPAALFELYVDAKKHSAVTGSRVAVSRRAGGRFWAFGGGLVGRNLLVSPGRLIVQSWRSRGWKRSDPDSILVLAFGEAPGGGRVDMVHANVPDRDHAAIKSGWGKHYWRPWRAYLAKSKR
jgi:activator of HSP90 ATPase